MRIRNSINRKLFAVKITSTITLVIIVMTHITLFAMKRTTTRMIKIIMTNFALTMIKPSACLYLTIATFLIQTNREMFSLICNKL